MRAALSALVLLIVILVSHSPAFALTHAWSRHYGGTGTQHIAAVATDASGNVYAAGHFYNAANFGGGIRTSAGGSDIVLVKLNAAGAYQWDLPFGNAADSQYATAVSTDAAGNVYVAGAFAGAVNFGGSTLTSLGLRDLFVVKFNAAGVHQWSKRFGDAADQQSASMLVDYTDMIYWTGHFAGAVNFGGGALTSAGGNDAFLAKLDAAGVHQWSKRFGDAGDQRGLVLGTDHWGNIDIGLDFTGKVNFGGGDLTSLGNFDIGIAQYSAGGIYQFGSRFGDAAEQHVTALATEPFTGYIHFTGGNSGTVNFGGGPITTAGGSDLFLARIDCYGVHMRSNGWGSAGDQTGTAVATDALGFVYVAGTFEGTIDVGGGPLVSAGGHDILLAGFTDAGAHAMSRVFGNPADFQQAACLVEDASYNVIMGGSFEGGVDFGGGDFPATAGDGFLAKLQSGVTPVGDTPGRFDEIAIRAQPNPFNPQTTLRCVVLERGQVRVDIHDLRGTRVATLVDREGHPGVFTVNWRGVRDDGSAVGSGVYFARLSVAGRTSGCKLVLLK
jgi:hypothetical protein